MTHNQRHPLPHNVMDCDEAVKWITANCMAIRRDNGEMDYSLGAMIAAFEAGRRTPASVSGDLREAVARAIFDTRFTAPVYPVKPPEWESVGDDEHRYTRALADAALTALTPHIAAEIAAAREEGRRNERAEVVAYGNPTQFSTWGNQVARFIEAVERGEHTKGEK